MSSTDTQQDPTEVARSSVRVTLLAGEDRTDLVVPRWMTVADLTSEYARRAGPAGLPARVPGLVTSSGRPLDPRAELQEAGVENGSVLVVAAGAVAGPVATASPSGSTGHRPGPASVVRLPGTAGAGAAGGRVRAPEAAADLDPTGSAPDGSTRPDGSVGPDGSDGGSRRRPHGPLTRPVLLGAGAVCAVGAAAVAATAAPGPVRVGVVAFTALAALLTAFPLPVRGAGPGLGERARAAASPVFAAAAGFGAAYSDGAGGLLLGLGVAALCATGAAAVARAWLSDEDDELTDVALVVGGTASVLCLVLLLLGSSVAALLAVAYAAAVVAARLLPYLVIDVPDEALLDLDRLANTAWSARDKPRGGRRRRAVVRAEGVHDVVRRGGRLLTAGTVVISGVVAVGGPVLVTGAGTDVVGISRVVMVLLGAAGLALVARSVRARVPRLALRLSAVLVAGWTGVVLLDLTDVRTGWWVFVAAAAVGAITVAVAMALGKGWRSVWWTRVADVVEALAVVLVVAAVPLASGLFTAVRSLVS